MVPQITRSGGQMSDTYGSGLSFTPDAPQGAGPLDLSSQGVNGQPPETAPIAAPQRDAGPSFGSSLRNMLPGANYSTPDPATSALDQSANLLEQRVKRANSIATNPIAQIFAPEDVQAARDFVPKAAEELSKIQQQRSGIMAGRVQARTLGLDPGEVSDHATMEDRITVAQSKALKGDMRAFTGLQAVHPERAAAIAPQVYETVASHLTKAQYAFDSLASMQNEGQYRAKVNQLRRDGTLADLESLGLKLPPTFEAFGAVKAQEGRALREARIGINAIGQKLEERNTYQPMEKKEAETYNGRITTAYGDQLTNGTWGRNGSTNARGLIMNMGTVDDYGKKYAAATPEQRKAISEEVKHVLPDAAKEKYREFSRTTSLALTVPHDGEYDNGRGGKIKLKAGDEFPAGLINTNPNVQQGIAEGLAAMLRGGHGGANVGLLNIETGKRGYMQALFDRIITEKAGVLNTLSEKHVRPYLTRLTQSQQRDVIDALKGYNEKSVEHLAPVARRAGALGLDATALGLGKEEAKGAIGAAVEEGRLAQIERMRPNFQPIGNGEGVLQLSAQRPGAGASALPSGAPPTTQLPGAQPLQTPVQQAGQPPAPPLPNAGAGGVTAPPPPPQQPGGGGQPVPLPTPRPAGGPSPTLALAGQEITLPPGVSPEYAARTQRIESGGTRDPWKASTSKSSASGAFQFIDSTWKDNKPAGAPDRAGDATPQQQAEAFGNLTQKNAGVLGRAGLPVNDTSLYIAHNLGPTGGSKLMQADPSADARTVVGERAAANNPKFFKGRPTVATVLERYASEMEGGAAPSGVRVASAATGVMNDGTEAEPGGPKSKPSSGGAALAGRVVANAAASALPGGTLLKAFWDVLTPKQKETVKDAAIEHAPAIASTAGAVVGGMAGNVPGGIAGGAVGGAAGQALKDYLKGNAQSPQELLKQGALGGVLGVMPAGRPIAGAAARVAGVGGIEATDAAVKGGDAADIVEAGAGGAVAGAAGEAFGRALGMAGHKVHSLFSPSAQKTVQAAAKDLHDATEVLKTEAPKLPGAGGTMTPNPKYEAAEAAKTKAEATLKDAGLKPEEAAYAHRVSSEGVPKQEAQVAKPGVLEQERLGRAYQEIENAFGAKGAGEVRATPRQRERLDEPETLLSPRAPTAEEMVKHGRIESVPLSEVRRTQKKMEWDAFNNGDHPPPLLKGFEDKPIAVRKENGEYLIYDGHHRTTLAMNHGQKTKEMYVIDAKKYDPENAGRKRNTKQSMSDDELLRELGAPPSGRTAGARGAPYSPVLLDGPMAAVAGKKVSAAHSELAEHVEMAVTAPAKNWQEKWVQLKEARRDLLKAERDAISSTATGRTKTAEDMRRLADTVRTQQEKAAKFVFGPEKGAEMIRVLKVVDARYRRLMDATNDGDLLKAATLKGEKGRDADRKFRAFAYDDPAALAAWTAMRRQGANIEKDVKDLVAAERIPVLGKVFSAAKLAGSFNQWVRDRAAGSPVKFSEILNAAPDTSARTARDIVGTAGARVATQGNALSGIVQ